MVAKKPAKAKKPVAKKVGGKKPAPAKAKPASAKAPVKAKPVAPKAKVAAAKPVVAKPVVAKPVVAKPAAKAVPPAKPAPAPKAAVAVPKVPLAVKPAPKATPGAKPAAPAAVLPARPRPPGGAGPLMPIRTGLRFQTPSPDADDDGDNSLSLLAGPRNVKPYLAKKGEQYMGKSQLEHFRTILRSWKRDLMEEVDRTVTHMKDEAANPPDPNDRATLESEFSLELRTRDRERKLIRKIDEALARIEDGSYGYCLETGEEIGIKRLEARPVATLSIEAQERRERREKQYGDRDDRYR